jgi:hypothetical protein
MAKKDNRHLLGLKNFSQSLVFNKPQRKTAPTSFHLSPRYFLIFFSWKICSVAPEAAACEKSSRIPHQQDFFDPADGRFFFRQMPYCQTTASKWLSFITRL